MATFAEDQHLVPSTQVDGPQLPVTPALGDPISLASTNSTLYTTHKHTHTHILENNKNQLFFKVLNYTTPHHKDLYTDNG